MNPISTLRKHCDIAGRMITKLVTGQKPPLNRAPASTSTSSQASQPRERSPAPSEFSDREAARSAWGYIYAAATFVKSPVLMSKREKQFATDVRDRLQDISPPRSAPLSPAPTREETIRAQLAQWRAEDEARDKMSLQSWDEL